MQYVCVWVFAAGRTAEDFVTWLKKKTGPPATTVEDVKAATSHIEKNDVVVMGFFKVDLLETCIDPKRYFDMFT